MLSPQEKRVVSLTFAPSRIVDIKETKAGVG